MSNYAGGTLSVCPFYHHEAQYSITCEGPDESCGVRICFGTERAKEEWQKAKCFVFDYELYCPLAMALLIHNDCALARCVAHFDGFAGRKKEKQCRG